MSVPHLLPLLQPEQERVVITLTPMGAQASINVTPEQVRGDWERVTGILVEALKVACLERAKALAAQQARVVVPSLRIEPGGVH
jgi:hypothetical protein